jgi:hypothetical protein
MTLLLALVSLVVVGLRSRSSRAIEGGVEFDVDDVEMPLALVGEHQDLLEHGYGDEPDDPPLPRLRLPGGRGSITPEELKALRRGWRAKRVLASRMTWLRARQHQARRSHRRAPRRRVARAAALRSCARARSADSVPPPQRGRGDLLRAGGSGSPTKGAASFQHRSYDGKLSTVRQVRLGKRRRLIQSGPVVCSTYASIAATCSDACLFKSGGCYVLSGSTIGMARRQNDAARGHSSVDVILEEVALIDKAFARRGVPQDGARGGRDLRLHVGGDVGSILGAQLLGEAALRWRTRRGGAVWTFTHNWREIPRSFWGSAINVLASVERAEDIEVARQAGYAAAIVVAEFPSKRAFTLPGSSARIVPCPAETNDDPKKSVTCASCRLCLDRDLLGMNLAIGFEAHGQHAGQVRKQLAKQVGDGLFQIRRRKGEDRATSQEEARRPVVDAPRRAGAPQCASHASSADAGPEPATGQGPSDLFREGGRP